MTDEIKNLIDDFITTNSTEVQNYSNKTLLEMIDIYCQSREHMVVKIREHFMSLNKTLKMIEKDMCTTLYPHHVSATFWAFFIKYSYDKRKLDISTIEKNTHHLKSVMKYCQICGITLSSSALECKINPHMKQKLILTPAEISRIYYFDYFKLKRRKHHIKSLIQAKDMFVLSCNLGQRYNDMQSITEDNFSDSIFKIIQQKTNNEASMDINEMAIDKTITYEILNKYNYTAPFKGDISNYDKLIKEVLEYVGINDEFEQLVYENRNKFINYIPKSKMIASHTARRCFISNNINQHKHIAHIMAATGHKTVSQFLKYIQPEEQTKFGIY